MDMKIMNLTGGVVAGCAALLSGVATVAWQKGRSVRETVELGAGALAAATARHSIADRTAAILAKKPQLGSVAKSAGGKLRILVFKNERSVEVRAPGWKAPRIYPMTAFSGTLGPKLREGDGQIPEGLYGIGYLNPNSSYYLSLKVTYPNAADRARAKADGRANLGGDIMIHGKAVTIGCVPVGDDAIEEIFYLASAVGIKNVSVVIAPYDMRNGRKPELERSPLTWYPDLCREIDIALCGAAKLYGRFLDHPSDESLMDVVMAVENGYWDGDMVRYMTLELDRETPRPLYTTGGEGVRLDSHSLAVFLAGEMLGFNPPAPAPVAWTVIVSRSVPDENEEHRGYLSPFRIHLFPATPAGIALAKEKLTAYLSSYRR